MGSFSSKRHFEARLTYPVIALGKSSTNLLGVIRAFGRRGIPVYTLSNSHPNTSCIRSRYIRERRFITRWTAEDLRQSLLQLGEALPQSEKIVVFPSNDVSLLTYSSVREALPAKFADSVPPRRLVELSLFKDKFYDYVSARNLPHPKSYRMKFLQEREERLEQYLPFPFVLKPVLSHSFVERFQKKLFEVKNREDFRRYSRMLANLGIDMLAQELIPGDYYYMVYFYISKDRQTSAVAGFHKVRQTPVDFGVGSLVENFWDEELISRTMDLVRTLEYTGIGEVEYKYDEVEKRYKILEINARSITFNRLSAYIGMDLEYLAYLDAVGALASPQKLAPRPVTARWMDFTQDFISLLQLRKERKITLPQILRSYKNLKLDGYFAWDDWSPFLHETYQFVKAGFNKMWRNSR